MRSHVIVWGALTALAGCATEPRREAGRMPPWYRLGAAASGDEWSLYNAEVIRLGHARHARWLDVVSSDGARTKLLVAFDCDAGTTRVDSTGSAIPGDEMPWRYPPPNSMLRKAHQVACRYAD